MTEVLHAWIENEYVGHFERSGSTQVARFFYNTESTHLVSLSLPRDGSSSKRAAQHFLDGLIPETPFAQEAMRTATKARSTSSWDLLSAVTGDLPGGILLHPGRKGLDRGVSYTQPATEAAIEAEIIKISRGENPHTSPDGIPPRFSLAGAQGKFAITQDQTDYYWSDAATPSTHIVKPAHLDHTGLNEIEARSLELARAMGLDAAHGEVRPFGRAETFIVERFDREEHDDGNLSRLHMEDLAQALGVAPGSKYSVSFSNIMTLFEKHNLEHLKYPFLEQLAFNVVLGNADAHGKNYTLIHRANKVNLSPLYDTIPISLYPSFNQNLGMKIGKKEELKGVVPSDWELLSKLNNLDTDHVLRVVKNTSQLFLEHAETTLGDTELVRLRREEFEELLRRAERTLQRMPASNFNP